jgi:hypothetical protein
VQAGDRAYTSGPIAQNNGINSQLKVRSVFGKDAKSAEQQNTPSGSQQDNARNTSMLGMSIGDSQSFLTTPTSIGDPQSVSQGTQYIGGKRSNPETTGSNRSRRSLNEISSSLCSIYIGLRCISRVSRNHNITHSTCELDSHEDTCIAGPNCIILEYTNQVANVSAYSDIYDELTNVPIVTAAMYHIQ